MPETLDDAFASVITFTRSVERLTASLAAILHTTKLVGSAAEGDPELMPELAVALENLQATAEAIARAHTFATTRLEVDVQKIIAAHDGGATPTEGEDL